MKYEIWYETDLDVDIITLTTPDNKSVKNLLGITAKLELEFEADSWEEAVKIKEEFMGLSSNWRRHSSTK